MVRKRGGAAETAVMEVEVGGGTRNGARAEITVKAKRRKLEDGGFRISSPYMQLRNRRIKLRNSVDYRWKNPSSTNNSGFSSSSSSSSCGSSNGTSEKRNEREEPLDLEEDSDEAETSTCGCCIERSERRPFSDLRKESEMNSVEKSSYGVDSKRKASDAECCCSYRRSTMKKHEMRPTEAELEEFFSAAEKNLRENFYEKYNFDFVKEMPLEGRCEWVKLSP